jgi:hypothetical protein
MPNFTKIENQRNELFEAINTNELQAVKKLVLKPEIVKYINAQKNGQPPLHLAIKKNNQELVGKLLKVSNINVNALNEDGDAALHLAIISRNLVIVDKLLATKNIDINAVNQDGCTALHLATNKSDLEIMGKLLDAKNIDVNAVDRYGDTALHYAIRKHDLKALDKLLTAKNIDVNAVDQDGFPPLLIAAKNQDVEIVDKLVKAGANIGITKLEDFLQKVGHKTNYEKLDRKDKAALNVHLALHDFDTFTNTFKGLKKVSGFPEKPLSEQLSMTLEMVGLSQNKQNTTKRDSAHNQKNAKQEQNQTFKR